MRGLKPSPGGVAKNLLVASFTDAWIETLDFKQEEGEGIKSHLLQMRGLKHYLSNVPNSYIVSHLLQMRGLKR